MPAQSATAAARLATSAFREYSPELHRYLLRRVHHLQDADDLAQEVFARLLRVRDAELVRKPLAYLLGIAMHVVREFRQRKDNDRVVFDSVVSEELCEQASEGVVARDPADDLEISNRLDRALALLPPTHQLVLLLVKRDGLSHTEAARTAGLSVHTIEKYVVEARARLRLMLEER
jgi:RNA polymerase sigma-70 factor (ECF subfamily)